MNELVKQLFDAILEGDQRAAATHVLAAIDARLDKCNLIALSALLTTTMPNMKTIIDAIIEAGLHDKVKIMVGGAPVTVAFAQQIGADGYASDASRAVTRALILIKAA